MVLPLPPMPGPVEVWFWLWLSEGLCARLSAVHATYPGGTTLKYFSMLACGQSAELVASLLHNKECACIWGLFGFRTSGNTRGELHIQAGLKQHTRGTPLNSFPRRDLCHMSSECSPLKHNLLVVTIISCSLLNS